MDIADRVAARYRQAAVLPLVITEGRVKSWIENATRRRNGKALAAVIFQKSERLFGVAVNFENGTNERFEIEFNFFLGDGIRLQPKIRGVR